MAVGQGVHDARGDSGGNVADANQRQDLQEEVHGGMGLLVKGGESDNEQVPSRAAR